MIGRHHVELVMGTAVTFDIRDEYVPVGAIEEAVSWLHHVDATFSPYKDDSPITHFGRGYVSRESLSDEVIGVLDLCDVLRIDTDGAFDCFRLPAPNGTTCNPCGLVKGWSIDKVADILRSWSAENFSINAGGDVVVAGHSGDGEPWRVGIRHPYEADKVAAVVSATGPLAVATSATYERGTHIIDPRTGLSADGLTSVTVVGPNLTFVDAYATAVFVMGLDGLTWLAEHEGYGAFAVAPDGLTHSTPIFDLHRS